MSIVYRPRETRVAGPWSTSRYWPVTGPSVIGEPAAYSVTCVITQTVDVTSEMSNRTMRLA
jgi:hypothetical protein